MHLKMNAIEWHKLKSSGCILAFKLLNEMPYDLQRLIKSEIQISSLMDLTKKYCK